jgi:hypothetical protein
MSIPGLSELVGTARGFAREVLREAERGLDALPVGPVVVQHAAFDGQGYYVTVFAPGVAAEVGAGDFVYGGMSVAHDPEGTTEVAPRIYRVACGNGSLAEEGEGRRLEFASARPPLRWKAKLREVVEQSFSGGCVDEETRHLRRALAEVLPTPYEHLIHLEAQGLVDDMERSRIQREFDLSDDPTLYGLMNAITRIAHVHRNHAQWRRALALERLGGEVARGDHTPPVGSPAFV